MHLETGLLPIVFPEILLKMMAILGGTRPKASTTPILEVDEDKYDGIKDVQSPPGVRRSLTLYAKEL